MAEKQNIHVLVAEDDNFQRLALIDILTLCDYQVTAVENGRLARDELLKEDSNIDIVLLDLRMPEMDGWELLCLMQKQEHLKRIPVIMMSFGDEQENVTLCLSSGAKDYLVKPLRIQNVKGLAKYVEHNPNNQNPTGSGYVGIQQYKVIRTIGQGAGGSVELVKRRTDGQLFAMKTISMKFMGEQEKKMAQSEVTLLKVLVAPSIIRYYESFVENESIHIVMEYAQMGALSDKISEHKMNGIPFDEDTILYFTAQLIISVLFMHSKNILHRDIKSQNLFMTKDNIVKLGDFGISKALGTNADLAKTLVGTPYFMSPEVCSGETYGQKADIWALGCTLYEMVMLKRPFDNDNINVLFSKIRKEDPPPLHENTSADIRMLITFMLQKDPAKRPSVWDLAKIPSINKNIRKYYETEAPDDGFLKDYIIGGQKMPISNRKPAEVTVQQSSQKESDGKPQEPSSNTIEQTIKALSESLEPYDQKVSMMRVERNVINGEEIFKWFNQYYPNSQTQDLVNKLEELVEKKYIHHISGPKYQNNPLSLYRFQSDMPGIPANHYKIWTKQARFAITILQEIFQQANLILSEVADQYTGKIDEDLLIRSKKYCKFLEMVCELQKIYLQDLQKENERKCFFINLMQVMYFHRFIRDKYIKKKNEMKAKVSTIFDKLFALFPFFSGSDDEFFYKIGYHQFNLDEVKHGILRGNKRHRGSKFKPFNESDDRQKFSFPQDLRVLFLFKEEDILPSELKFIQLETMNEELDEICIKFISTHVCIDSVENDITLHKIFQIYLSDFGSSYTDVIQWAAKYTKIIDNVDELVTSIKQGEIFVQFQEKFEP